MTEKQPVPVLEASNPTHVQVTRAVNQLTSAKELNSKTDSTASPEIIIKLQNDSMKDILTAIQLDPSLIGIFDAKNQ